MRNTGASFIFFGGAGAIVNVGILTVIDSTFSENSSGVNVGIVGAILNQGTLTVTNSIFSGNGHAFNGVDTAGIDNRGTLTITNSEFSGNSGNATGAISNGGEATITSSTFSNNQGGVNGGFGAGGFTNGFSSSPQARATIINSTFFGNSSIATWGNILNVLGGTLAITNSTILSGEDSNIANSGVALLNGTILASAQSFSCDPFPFGGPPIAITDLGYNISDDNSCGFSAIGSHNNTNPMVDPAGLANNGGPTQTIALQSGSPAIDAIPVASCTDQASPPNPITTDQRGFPRPDAKEQVCDIGAYEFQDAPAFAGQPGKPNCHGKSVSALNQEFGNLNAAASALGFSSVKALQSAIKQFCNGG